MMIQPKNITKLPGVYLFKDAEKNIIYIGKAKNIAKRIASYFSKQMDLKTEQLLQEATSIDTIPTQTETEALYLEAHLVKEYQPKFNILLKEGNPFVYILFTEEKVPKIKVVRTKEKKGTYFGPFLHKRQAFSVYKFLETTFQLKLCKTKIEQGCLQYHIGLCAGACKKDFDLDFYVFKLSLAKYVLSKDAQKAIQLLDKEIKELSSQLLFEQAQRLTEYKENLERIVYTIEKLSSMPSKQVKKSAEHNLQLLIKIKQRLKLQHIPYVIDCFDISHMQGQAIVGASVRYVHGQPEKKSFRHFQIKSLTEQNDYAALQEIVQRRYKDPANIPNLVIVDGGKGQINAIKPFVGHAELVGLAKREETIISSQLQDLIKLDPLKQEDALLLQIRDYTHHFAISYHRKKRSFE